VALQGTLETFALPDVLRLLASTKKTGRLRLTGGRGSGSIWLDEGEIVAGEASRSPLATEGTEVVFELLRFEDGDFIFETDEASAEPGAPVSVEDALSGAEALLSEWTAIEAVVPSTAAFVSLRKEIDGDEVTLDADRWRQVVAVGGGRTVAGLGEHLGLSDMAVSRMVKELIETGVVDLGDAPEVVAAVEPSPRAEPTAAPAWSNDSAFADTPSFTETRSFNATPDEPPTLTVVDGENSGGVGFDGSGALSSNASGDLFDPHALVIEEPDFGGAPSAPEHLEPAPAAVVDDEPTDAAEIARQLANLSPKAAKAVAAAAKATTQEEREAALAEVDDDEEPINRGLLLKFLGSVNG